MERRAFPFLLLLIVAFSLSSAVEVTPFSLTGPSSGGSNSFSLTGPSSGNLPEVELPSLGLGFVFLVGLVSVGFISLIYMMGTALEMPALIALAKENLRELIVGAIIVVIVWAIVIGADTVVGVIFLQESVPAMGAAGLQPHINYMEELYLKVADAYHAVALYQGISYFASGGIMYVYAGEGSSPYFGVSVLLGPLSNATNSLTVQILTLRLLKMFTYYINGIFPTFVLPIALAFRLFPFTRKMGNTLIAICLGAIFVFPLSMVFVGDFWDATDWKYKDDVEKTAFTYDKFGTDNKLMDGMLTLMDAICGNVVMRTFLSLGEFVHSLIFASIFALSCLPYGYLPCFAFGFNWFLWVLWPFIVTFIQLGIAGTILTVFSIDLASSAGPGFESIAELLLPAVAEATGFSIISFFMIAFITFTGIKSISAALGGDYILYGVSRFV